ncbi:LysR family transcriptional regulator [Massilia sp. CF038]|uniref:LysR family transcriptional regulator n=1 Tax=Massilia sp. CF038 TaxID=1881045 RepID=UPI00091C801A|nr:LysR family transcriptional regulator [Massilia sp. CF038]SHG70735.1 transcriptional regulator, LysR family [Massilia sp. CF038]
MIGNFTLDQLRILVAIDDTGSFSAAARRLGRVQSAISQAIFTLEELQGVRLFERGGHRPRLTQAGRVLLGQARLVLASAERFAAAAADMRAGIEPELVIAIDPLVPSAPLADSLRALGTRFPNLQLSFSTEGLGGSLRRLRAGTAALGVCVLLPSVPADLDATALFRVRMVPVVAATHPLAAIIGPLTRDALEPYIQLVLSDPVAPDAGNFGIVGSRLWRFVDLGRRLDFLLAGFGWCRMPEHLVLEHIASGHLVELTFADDASPREGLPIHAAHLRERPLGPAGRWLLEELRARTNAAATTGPTPPA